MSIKFQLADNNCGSGCSPVCASPRLSTHYWSGISRNKCLDAILRREEQQSDSVILDVCLTLARLWELIDSLFLSTTE